MKINEVWGNVVDVLATTKTLVQTYLLAGMPRYFSLKNPPATVPNGRSLISCCLQNSTIPFSARRSRSEYCTCIPYHLLFFDQNFDQQNPGNASAKTNLRQCMLLVAIRQIGCLYCHFIPKEIKRSTIHVLLEEQTVRYRVTQICPSRHINGSGFVFKMKLSTLGIL